MTRNKAGLVYGLEKFAGQEVRQRSGSPKLQVLNTALLSASARIPPEQVMGSPSLWRRWIESAVGSHLINQGAITKIEIQYWREKDLEVDFVLKKNHDYIIVEVKSGSLSKLTGVSAFTRQFTPKKLLLVGKGGIPLEEWFAATPLDFFT